MCKNKVLIPIDDSQFSLQILPYVQRFLDPKQHELILMHVEKEPELLPVKLPSFEELDIYQDQEEFAMRTQFADSMRQIVKELSSAGFAVTTDVAFGKPAQAIEKQIKQHPVEMIAMTTHGRTGLERVLVGSVAEHILHHCHLPVLLLHPTGENQTTDESAEFST